MAAFDTAKQKMVSMHGVRMEFGNGVTMASVSGQTFTVATKLKKILGGMGVMRKDGIIARVTTGLTSAGQVTFTRVGPISEASGTGYLAADTIDYEIFGY